MKSLFSFALAIACALPCPAFAAGYALHGTYLDYGPAQPGLVSAPRRVPAVLYVVMHGREARLRLDAPGARCVPEFGESHYFGPAQGEGNDSLAVHLEHKSGCNHVSDDARLFLRFSRARPHGITEAVLTDHVRHQGGPVLFQAN